MNYNRQLDWKATERKARGMHEDSLRFAIKDCHEAGIAADKLERAGCRVSKTRGYYSDESSVYVKELVRRGLTL